MCIRDRVRGRGDTKRRDEEKERRGLRNKGRRKGTVQGQGITKVRKGENLCSVGRGG